MKASALKAYRDSLYSSLSRDLAEFEKNFLLISAGTFTFSIAFMKDIVPMATAEYLGFLFVGWLLIAAATGIIMLSFLYAADSANRLWKHVDGFATFHNLADDDTNLTPRQLTALKTGSNKILEKSKKRLAQMRYAAVGCFIGGILSIGIFVAINSSKKTIPPQKKETKTSNRQVVLKLKDSEIISNDTVLIVTQKERAKTKHPSRPRKPQRKKRCASFHCCCCVSVNKDSVITADVSKRPDSLSLP